MATIAEKPAVAPATPALNKDEILRYSRHLIMPEVGMDGQLKLKAAKVLCIGAGGLGSPLIMYQKPCCSKSARSPKLEYRA